MLTALMNAFVLVSLLFVAIPHLFSHFLFSILGHLFLNQISVLVAIAVSLIKLTF